MELLKNPVKGCPKAVVMFGPKIISPFGIDVGPIVFGGASQERSDLAGTERWLGHD
jgi:hypothetical protein